MKNNFTFCLFLLISSSIAWTQETREDKLTQFTQQDSLRGTITKERSWWDLKKYQLSVKINPQDSSIIGSNKITYLVLDEYDTMQIDLQEPLRITQIIQDGSDLKFARNGNAYFVTLFKKQLKGTVNTIEVIYEGKPKSAINAPWDGGIVWKKDTNGSDFIASSCQGIGASVWWPNKDHMYDEVESMDISLNVPSNLIAVSNGRLRGKEIFNDATTTYNWSVVNPINNYGVNFSIGNYTSFTEVYKGEKGSLDCTYYVLKDNVEKAKDQFKDVSRMLKALEYWFGAYPFYEDGYKLVETPFLGMEHQSNISYGNNYQNGYSGTDLSGTGWGLKFDFIIVHESGHEWFGNNITNKDRADMWIHESFTSYSESLFVEYYYGKQAGYDYVIGTRRNIVNDKPPIGFYNVNDEGSSDMYFKGANMLHTLRQIMDNDKKWRKLLRGLNSTFYHQIVTTKQIENYISSYFNRDISSVFNQYLRDRRVPSFEYKITNGKLQYRWANCVSGFDMPIKVTIGKKVKWLNPIEEWKSKSISSEIEEIEIDSNFYSTKDQIGK
ncbi:M1 family metallopeptidase [Flavobacterium algicola]|uniref:M1 family metallopeptidase n=1 Tax=Flavobacterium algicola TaxID=556529 RepID=UPI001EFC7ADD|nr:M1 family metallopeptidase [Flavobacterium algicola]MCG9792751.1 M1 family metallopeptidase [Flavobacterium algicola]